jgi:ABC-2 type transport system permease protein
MKQFGKILKFELQGYLKNKMFVGITLFLVAAIALVMFIPNITAAIAPGDTPDVPDEKPTMLVHAEDGALTLLVKEYFSEAFEGYNVTVEFDEPRDLQIDGEVYTDVSTYTVRCPEAKTEENN